VGGTALGTGRGDVLTSLSDLPSAEVVLVCPPFGLSTAHVYRLHDEVSEVARFWAPAGRTGSEASCRNDLERAAGARHPEVVALGARLRSLGARFAALTGSGSTVFGLFGTAGAADRAAEAMGEGTCRVIRTATLGRQAYRASLRAG
jgi:4-diphosphocytidyl-2-C-methyl-D-erythritol kinase